MQASTRPSRHALVRSLPIMLAVAACVDAPTSPATEAVDMQAAVSGTPVDVWWPKPDVWVDGRQRLQAYVPGMRVKDYRMHWQVDGGALTQMSDSYSGEPHKEAWVDFTGWTWKGAGPYVLTFVATDRKGRRLGSQDVTINVGSQPATPPPPVTTVPSGNPFAAAALWVDPYSRAKQQADAWRATRPTDAAYMDRIAAQPQAEWLGDWVSDVRTHVSQRTDVMAAAGALPLYVLYNIPVRDCNQYSAGGASGPDAYRAFIKAFVDGLAGRRAAVILEPDALAAMDCLPATQQQTRLALIDEAVRTLSSNGVSVYIDAGNAWWHAPDVMAARLNAAGVANAAGFALNVANFKTTGDNTVYGEQVSALAGGKHFVIDTGRNGLGPTADYQWCNPSGRALGTAPTAATGHPLVDALLWIKKPGESDGTCNGGPTAGAWWADYALGLAQRASLLASGE